MLGKEMKEFFSNPNEEMEAEESKKIVYLNELKTS
jgi:hypothetical protein